MVPGKEAAKALGQGGQGVRLCAEPCSDRPGPGPSPPHSAPLPAGLVSGLSAPAAEASPEDPAAFPGASQRPGPGTPPWHPASPSPRRRWAGPLRQREGSHCPASSSSPAQSTPSHGEAQAAHPRPRSPPGAQTSAAEQGLDGRRARPGARRQQPGLQVLQQGLAGEEAVGHGGGDDARGPPLHPAAAVEAWGGGGRRGKGRAGSWTAHMSNIPSPPSSPSRWPAVATGPSPRLCWTCLPYPLPLHLFSWRPGVPWG